MAPLILGYWKIRGLAQPIRCLLGYTKTDFEDVMYECSDAPTFDKSCWLDVKETLGLDFPNLPYLIDGDFKVTQSNAVIRYIAQKHNMVGETEEEMMRVAIMENQLMDFRNGFMTICYHTKPELFEEKCAGYKKSVLTVIGLFEKFLGSRKFLAGDKLTFVDFIMYELLDQHRCLQGDILDSFKGLTAFMKRFEELPEIIEFMKSPKFFKGPLNNKSAIFGGKL